MAYIDACACFRPRARPRRRAGHICFRAHLRLSIAVDVQARARGLGGRADLMLVVHRFAAHTLGRQIDVASRIHAGPLPLELVRSEEHPSEPQSLMRTSYAVFCLTKKNNVLL